MSHSAISIKGLTKDFSVGMRGVKLRAVDDLTLEVGDNEIFGLIGPNGSGKSTTIKVVLGLLDASLGECQIYGKPSHTVAARHSVGFLPEAPYFYRYLSGPVWPRTGALLRSDLWCFAWQNRQTSR